jgi:cellulose synthase/poly-beta-1,6-N-acetylglucosamine synthase-like glycosyltransferase
MIADETNSFVVVDPSQPANLRIDFAHPVQAGFLSIVIPVYADAAGLGHTLDGLAIEAARCEIIVANDGGDPAVSALCKERGVREVAIVPNGGSYRARNRAIAQSRGEFIGLLDADVEPAPGWIDTAFAAMTRADFAGGSVVERTPDRPSIVDHYQLIVPAMAPVPRRDSLGPAYVPTANVVVRRAIFEELGGFDERFRSGADLEFSDRVARAGRYRFIIDEALVVTHGTRTYRQLLQRQERVLYGGRNLCRVYGDRFDESVLSISPLWRRFLPHIDLLRSGAIPVRVGPWTFTRLFFFAWWMKLRSIPIRLRVDRAFARAVKQRS